MSRTINIFSEGFIGPIINPLQHQLCRIWLGPPNRAKFGLQSCQWNWLLQRVLGKYLDEWHILAS